VDLASPAKVESPLIPGPAELSWDSASLAFGMGMGGPRSVGFDASNVSAKIPHATLAADRASGALAPSGDGGTDAEISFSGLALPPGDAPFPPVDGHVSAELSPPPRTLLSGRIEPPIAARAIDVSLESGDARLQAVGEVALDAEGVLDGAITLRIAGAEALPALIAALPPERQKLGNAVAGAIMAFGRPTTVDGRQGSELLLEIDNGRAKVGPVDFELPRLRL
jgi:hypothetical protein